MKKLCLFILAVLLLSACAKKPAEQSAHFSRQWDFAQCGDTIYNGRPGIDGVGELILNGALNRTVTLCRDPLCTHGEEIFCAESERFSDNRAFTTDGTNVYMLANDRARGYDHWKATGEKRKFTVLSVLDPELPAGMRELQVFETSGMNRKTPFTACSGVVYYKEGSIPDGMSREEATAEDWVNHIWRIPKDGGKAERFSGIDLDVTDQFDIDGAFSYVIPAAGDRIDCTPVSGGEPFSRTPPDGKRASEIAVADFGTFLFCTDRTREAEGQLGSRTSESTAVYRMDPDGDGIALVPVLEDAAAVILSDGWIWSSTPELTYHGTPTYAPGTVQMGAVKLDVFSETAGDLRRTDPATGETKTWTDAKHIRFLGYSAGYALAYLIDYEAYGEIGEIDKTIYRLALNDDGSITDAGTIRP